MPRRRAVQIAVAAVVAAALFAVLRPAPLAVDVGEVRRGPLRVTVDEEGRTRVRYRYVVAAPVDGRLLRISLEEGDGVAAGQVVAHVRPMPLDPRARASAEARLAAARARVAEAEARVAKARAGAAQAARDLVRAERLAEAGTLAPGELERRQLDAASLRREVEAARAGADAARHELEVARAALLAPDLDRELPQTADARCGDVPCLALTAPVAGRVLRVFEESERSVAPGTPLIEIGDPRDLEIVADVLSTEAVRVRPGAPVIVEEWGGDEPLAARVRRVEPSGFTKISALGVEEQRVNVIAEFDAAPESLGDGFRVEVRIVVWESEDVVVAPATALFRSGASWSVFVVEGGRARLRTVSLGHRAAFDMEVLSGLEPGERVVLHPSDQVTDGARVKPLHQP